MFSRSGKFYLAVLIVSSMNLGLVAAENGDDDLSTVDVITGNGQTAEVGDQSGTAILKTNNTRARQKSRSIKMIVGGQSTDGVAKEVVLPVED